MHETNKKMVFFSNSARYEKIPGCPIAYWVSDQFSANYQYPQFSEQSEVITGMTIGDNNKYLRLWYELNNRKIAFNRAKMNEISISQTKWIPYSKGGSRRNWYGNYEYVVNWAAKDNFNRSKTTLQHLYLREALTWPFITPGTFSARLLPKGSLWDVAGSPCFFKDKINEYYALGLLCSKPVDYILKVVNPTINVQANDIAQLPYIFNENISQAVIDAVNQNICESKEDWDAYETSCDFKKHPLL